jgi:hypothetical protein
MYTINRTTIPKIITEHYFFMINFVNPDRIRLHIVQKKIEDKLLYFFLRSAVRELLSVPHRARLPENQQEQYINSYHIIWRSTFFGPKRH